MIKVKFDDSGKPYVRIDAATIMTSSGGCSDPN